MVREALMRRWIQRFQEVMRMHRALEGALELLELELELELGPKPAWVLRQGWVRKDGAPHRWHDPELRRECPQQNSRCQRVVGRCTPWIGLENQTARKRMLRLSNSIPREVARPLGVQSLPNRTKPLLHHPDPGHRWEGLHRCQGRTPGRCAIGYRMRDMRFRQGKANRRFDTRT